VSLWQEPDGFQLKVVGAEAGLKDLPQNYVPRLTDKSLVTKYHPTYGDDEPLDAVGYEVNIHHPKLERYTNFILVDAYGNKFIHFDTIIISKKYQGQGLGTEIFSDMAKNAAAEGFKYIHTHAAGKNNSSMNGYYTWPLMGCNETIDDIARHTPRKAEEIRDKFPDADDILDVLAEPGGREWWKENGMDLYNAKFDLTEGSKSWDVLNAYITEREKRKSKPKV